MNKLPVGRTIADAYRFTFGQLGTVIGLIWFPMVLDALLNILPMLPGAEGGSATGQASAAVAGLAATLLGLLLSSIMYAAVARQALGIRKGPAVFHFALGMTEFRVYGGLLLLYFPMVIGAITIASVLASGGPAAMLGPFIAVPGMFAIFYLMVRLGFLLVPSVVVESKVDFARLWTLTAGNFGRLLAVLLAVVIPAWIANVVAILALLGKDIARTMAPFSGTSPADAAVIEKQFGALTTLMQQHFPEIMGVGLILAPFSIALMVAASCSAYRTLAGPVPPRRETVA